MATNVTVAVVRKLTGVSLKYAAARKGGEDEELNAWKNRVRTILEEYGWDLGNEALKKELGFLPGEAIFAYFKRINAMNLLKERFNECKKDLGPIAEDLGMSESALMRLLAKMDLVELLKNKPDKTHISETLKGVEEALERKGAREMFDLTVKYRPKEVRILLSILLPELNLDIEDLNRLIWGFRNLNVNEVAQLHGFNNNYIQFADLFIKEAMERASLLSTFTGKQQEVFIQMFLRLIYKAFSKDPERKVAELREEIRRAIEKGKTENAQAFLRELLGNVEEEFIIIPKGLSSQVTHMDQSRKKLTLHQLIGAHKLRTSDRFALLDGTRTGKTLQVLAALEPEERTMVVSPAGVVDTWVQEENDSFSPDLRVRTLDSSHAGLEDDLKELSEDDYAIVVLRGDKKKRERLINAVRGRKRTIIHISFETLREMNNEKNLKYLKGVQEGLDGIVVDEWQYAENFVDAERDVNAKQAAVIQAIRPPRRWVISASPYRSDPHKLFSMFHYLLGDLKNAPDWAKDGHVFKRTFTENMDGLRWLSGELSQISLRRTREDVWDIYVDGEEEEGKTIPARGELKAWEYEMPEDLARQSLGVVKSFRSWVVDVYNPAAPPERRVTGDQLNILTKLNYLRWLSTDIKWPKDERSLLEALGLTTPFWGELDKCVEQILNDPDRPEAKIVLFAQNVPIVEKLLEKYKEYGCVRIDGQVTGFARDPETNDFYLNDKGRRYTQKSWNMKQFQENDKVRICVANVRAGVGIDLSRGDAVVYAQMPETYEQLYQSMSRILGPNQPDHLRSAVDMYFMCSTYPKSLQGELQGEDEKLYYNTGTVDQVQFGRLQAQQTRFGIIMDGGVSDIERDGDPLELVKHVPHYIDDMSLRKPKDLSEGLSDRQAIVVQTAGYIGNLIAIADTAQRNAIYDIIKAAFDLKEDLRPLSKAISEIDSFNLNDFACISDLNKVANRYILKKLYKAMPKLLSEIYEGRSLLLARVEDLKARHGGKVPDYVVVAGLAVLHDGELDLAEKRHIFYSMASEIAYSDMNKKAEYSRLIAALDVFRKLPVPVLRLLKDDKASLKQRLDLFGQLGIYFAFTNENVREIALPEVKDFKGLRNAVEEAKPRILSDYFKEKFGIDIDENNLSELSEEQADLINRIIAALERGEREAENDREEQKFRRETRRLGEALSHVLDGTYYQWRNEQKGERRYGEKIGFLENDASFWEAWTEEVNVPKKDVEVKSGYFIKRRMKILKKLADLITSDPETLREFEDKEVCVLFEEYTKDPGSLGAAKRRQDRLGRIFGKLRSSEDITAKERELLNEEGLNEDKKPSEILDFLQKRLKELHFAIIWMEITEMARSGKIGKDFLRKISALVQRTKLIKMDPSFKVAQGLQELESLARSRAEETYKNVEVQITANPYLILKRGMLDKQLMNCFELENDPEFVRALVDDLGSRNKMLVIVRASGRFQAVAMAKIKRDEQGNPAIFLERILSREGKYDFEKEILETLYDTKVKKMRPETALAVMAPHGYKNPARLYSTGGYDEDEYSEAHFQLRKNYYPKKDGTVSKYTFNVAARMVDEPVSGGAPAGLRILHKFVAPFRPYEMYLLHDAPALEEKIFTLVPFAILSTLLATGVLGLYGFLGGMAFVYATFVALHAGNIWRAPPEVTSTWGKLRYAFKAPLSVAGFNMLTSTVFGWGLNYMVEGLMPGTVIAFFTAFFTWVA
ncbi:MAG: SNF2-related protein, partial [Candidatus Omnitrophota bacterium]